MVRDMENKMPENREQIRSDEYDRMEEQDAQNAAVEPEGMETGEGDLVIEEEIIEMDVDGVPVNDKEIVVVGSSEGGIVTHGNTVVDPRASINHLQSSLTPGEEKGEEEIPKN